MRIRELANDKFTLMRWLIRLSLGFQFLLIVLVVALTAFGFSKLHQMPVDVYPEFDPPLVEVQTEALGLSAAEVESLITVPLEADLLNGIAWLEQIYSESVTGLSSINLIFEPGTDPIRARQMVQERLTQTFALPNVSKPPTMLQPMSSTRRVMMVGMKSDSLTLIEMGVLAHWNIRPRLMGVPGVSNVAVWGQRERQLQVQVDPSILRANDVTLSQVIKTTGEALWYSPLSYLESSTPGTAGWIDTPNQRLTIRHELPISDPEELAQIAIAEKSGLVLGDVAKVVEGHQPLIGEAILDIGPGLLLVIEKLPGASTLEVTRGVEEALLTMQPGLSGIKFDSTIFRPATYIEQSINNLTMLAVIGVILAALVLWVFFLHWRVIFISLVAILLSFATAILLLYLRGATFNMMVLAGLVIAIGVVVDESLISAENIALRLSVRKKNKPRTDHFKTMFSVIEDATYEMRTPMVAATLIIILTVLPVFFMQGLSGSFFQPLAQSFVLAVVASMVVAITVTPVLSLTLLNNVGLTHRKSSIANWLSSSYSRLFARSLKISQWTYIAAGVAFALIIFFALPHFRIHLLTFKQSNILIKWEEAPGTSISEMSRILHRINKEIRTITGVKNVGSHMGRAITGDKVVGINSAEIWVNLDPKADYHKALGSIAQIIDGHPGVFREVGNYRPERTDAALMEKDEKLTVRIYGYDFKVLEKLSGEVMQVLIGVGGVFDVRAELQTEEPQVEIATDLSKVQEFGLKPGDVRRQAATLLSGIQVGSLYEDQRVFDVVVWGAPEIRKSVSDISDLMIEAPDGKQVPLGELADVSIVPAPVVIRRDSVSRFIDVTAGIRSRDYNSVSADIKKELKSVKFPLEYHAEVLGGSALRQATRQQLGIVVAVAIGIFLLLQASFSSWRLAFIVFLSLPIALTGGILAAFLGGGILSLGSLMGFLAILGIGIRSNIMLISHYQYLEKYEHKKPGSRLVIRGAQERLLPIMMTAMTVGLILLPAVILGSNPGNEIVYPMAIVILGGLATSTYLTLFIIPALCLRFVYTNPKG